MAMDLTPRLELVAMLQRSGEEGDIESIEKDMTRRIFQFSETTVRDIMVTLIDVVGVECGMSMGEVSRITSPRAPEGDMPGSA